MGYRDDVEVAAVEALKEASAAEILLRCLRLSHPNVTTGRKLFLNLFLVNYLTASPFFLTYIFRTDCN